MPRSISSDAIMYISPPNRPPPSSSLPDESDDIGSFEIAGDVWESDLVDSEVIEIFSSRFRSLSFSCVEDLLEYGFEMDAQI